LLNVIERALEQIEARNETGVAIGGSTDSERVETVLSVEAEPESKSDGLRGDDWEEFLIAIYRHRLESLPIGMFVESLADLPSSLWESPLASFFDPAKLGTFGPVTRAKVETIVTQLGTLLRSADSSRFVILPSLPTIRQASVWIDQAVRSAEPPTTDAFIAGFVEPLLTQIRTDFSTDVSTMCERRVGIRCEPETLEAVSSLFAVTRERVRQQVARVNAALKIRWPEGSSMVRRFLVWLGERDAARDVTRLAARLADELFDTSAVNKTSVTRQISAAWRTAGRQRLTPMSVDEIKAWSVGALPEIAPETTASVVCATFPTCERDNTPVWFSDTPGDRVLWWLHMKGEPAYLGDALGEMLLASSTIDESCSVEELLEKAQEAKAPRALAAQLQRDPRIVHLGDQQLIPAESCGFYRSNGDWCVRVLPVTEHRQTVPGIPLTQVTTFLVNGMFDRGIVDATAAGVHRFINEILGQVLGAELPSSVTPYVLADMLVLVSDGLVRHMRRRRLRWDSVALGVRARGKRGWVGHVVAEAAVPMLLSELDAALRHYYQDYADHVIDQLCYKKDDDEGDEDSRVAYVTQLGYGIPVIAVPAGWQLQADHSNVSPGVREVAARVRQTLDAGSARDVDFPSAPWLAALIKGHR
jgi:hypothetical protein